MKPSLVGKKYGRLTVVEKLESPGARNSRYKCVCECGGVKVTASNNFLSGGTKSCGCLHMESARDASIKARKHGKAGTRTYKTWQSMFGRCYSPSNRSFMYYGAKGITVCDRWRSFESFLEDMGERPDGMTLDRFDSSKNYEPGNCRWATKTDQANNRSNNVMVRYEDKTITLAQFARAIGLTHSGATNRLRRSYAKGADGVFVKEADL